MECESEIVTYVPYTIVYKPRQADNLRKYKMKKNTKIDILYS